MSPSKRQPSPPSRTKAVPTRTRLIKAAMRLIQQQGYHGAGTNEILQRAAAPRGSMYHHFPGGKADLAAACVAFLSDEMQSRIDHLRARGLPAADVIAAIIRDTALWTRQNEWREGFLLTTLVQDAGPEDAFISNAVRTAYTAMQSAISRLLQDDGIAPGSADDMALEIMSALEGAQTLSRALQDSRPLDVAADVFKRRITNAAR